MGRIVFLLLLPVIASAQEPQAAYESAMEVEIRRHLIERGSGKPYKGHSVHAPQLNSVDTPRYQRSNRHYSIETEGGDIDLIEAMQLAAYTINYVPIVQCKEDEDITVRLMDGSMTIDAVANALSILTKLDVAVFHDSKLLVAYNKDGCVSE